MRRVVILFGSLAVLAVAAWPEAAARQGAKRRPAVEATGADVSNRFVGTWKLVAIERFGPNGELLLTPAPPAFGSPNPTGVLVYDAAGYMGMTMMQSGRQKFAGAQPTPDEVKTALLSYTSDCGTFSVNDADGMVTHHVQTSLNPNYAPADERSGFQFSGTRLVLNPSRSVDGTRARVTWERVPDVTPSTPVHRRLIGFWKYYTREWRTLDGQLVRTDPPSPGFVIFSAAGYLATCVASGSYGSYFGRYEVNEKESYEVTRTIGSVNLAEVGQLALRYVAFAGDRAVLKPVPDIYNGRLVQRYNIFDRVSPPLGSTR